MAFRKAVREQSKGRIALVGPAGSGKSVTALLIAKALAGENGRIAVRCSENGSIQKYAPTPEDPAFGVDFDVDTPGTHSPDDYVRAIREAEEAGYDVLILDSLSHAWVGHEGAMEQLDRARAKGGRNDSFGAWREVTPLHNRMVEAITSAGLHVIATMRTKTAYEIEKNEKGKNVPVKIGLAPVQRDGLEYEFDVVADLDLDHNFVVSKTRCPALTDYAGNREGEKVGEILRKWLSTGEAPRPRLLTDEERNSVWAACKERAAEVFRDPGTAEVAAIFRDALAHVGLTKDNFRDELRVDALPAVLDFIGKWEPEARGSEAQQGAEPASPEGA